jgi:hypothetical protein
VVMKRPRRPKIQTGHLASGGAYYYLRETTMNEKTGTVDTEPRDESTLAAKAKPRIGRTLRSKKTE